MKRVYTLYRVSTKKQVDVTKDDIPMQRLACREFVKEQGWQLTKEFEEKGVSGFKVSAKDRDAIQDLKEAALHGEFDILLVFMFDRLGRIENETPFVLQWFAEHGIEVWSVNEGQQKFEQHVDKLLNYIRFWQASGESEKTSIRVKTRLGQMTEEGLYTGGNLSHGFHLVNKGRKNKKGHEMKDIEKEPNEADLVYRMYCWVLYEGYGSHQIAEMVNKEGHRTHSGAQFQSVTVLRILRNPINVGIVCNGKSKSEPIERLRIVTDEMFERTQEILAERSQKYEERRQISLSNKGKALLSGNIYCAHCGCRMSSSKYTESKKRKDGTPYGTEYVRYVCYHRSRGLNDCDGACTYRAERIDETVEAMMKKLFEGVSGCPQKEKIQMMYRKKMDENHRMQKQLEESIKKAKKQMEVLRGEISASLLGESAYSSEDLNAALTQLRARMKEDEKQYQKLREEDAKEKISADSVIPAYEQVKTWAEEFETCSLNQKKMIASQLFNRIEISKDYSIHIEVNFTYKQFLENWTGAQFDLSA